MVLLYGLKIIFYNIIKINNLSNRKINTYLRDYYKSIEYTNPDYAAVNTKLDNTIVNNFIAEIEKKATDEATDDWNTQLDVSSTMIHNFFNNILKTKSNNTNSDDMYTQMRNLMGGEIST